MPLILFTYKNLFITKTKSCSLTKVCCIKNSVVIDIINSAGGLSNRADIQNIDFDYVIKNGEKIIIPYIKEEINLVDENELININTATLEELMTLDGIGEKTAQKILEYRTNNEFEMIEDLMKVEGIGKGKFDKIAAYIVIK